MGMNEYLKAMHALAKLRMNADRMLAAAPTAEAKQWWDGYRQALHDMAVELSGSRDTRRTRRPGEEGVRAAGPGARGGARRPLRLGGYVGRRRAPVQPVQSGEAMLLTGMPSRRRVVRIPVWELSKTSQASSSLSRIIRSVWRCPRDRGTSVDRHGSQPSEISST